MIEQRYKTKECDIIRAPVVDVGILSKTVTFRLVISREATKLCHVVSQSHS